MKKDINLRIGMVLVFIGSIILLIKSMFWGLGFLPIIIGICFILFSKRNWVWRLIVVTITIITTLFLLLLGTYLRGNNAFEEFYFSYNFTGKVRIIYAKDCGFVPKMKGSWTIINVDTNHTLIIRHENERAFTKSKFILVNEDGSKIAIPRIEKLTESVKVTSIFKDNPKRYDNYDVDILDLIVIKPSVKAPSDKEIKYIDSLSFLKFIELKKELKK